MDVFGAFPTRRLDGHPFAWTFQHAHSHSDNDLPPSPESSSSSKVEHSENEDGTSPSMTFETIFALDARLGRDPKPAVEPERLPSEPEPKSAPEPEVRLNLNQLLAATTSPAVVESEPASELALARDFIAMSTRTPGSSIGSGPEPKPEAGQKPAPAELRPDEVTSPSAPAPAAEPKPELFCICESVWDPREVREESVMVGCDATKPGCKLWYHPACIRLPMRARDLPEVWACPLCEGTAIEAFYTDGQRPVRVPRLQRKPTLYVQDSDSDYSDSEADADGSQRSGSRRAGSDSDSDLDSDNDRSSGSGSRPGSRSGSSKAGPAAKKRRTASGSKGQSKSRAQSAGRGGGKSGSSSTGSRKAGTARQRKETKKTGKAGRRASTGAGFKTPTKLRKSEAKSSSTPRKRKRAGQSDSDGDPMDFLLCAEMRWSDRKKDQKWRDMPDTARHTAHHLDLAGFVSHMEEHADARASTAFPLEEFEAGNKGRAVRTTAPIKYGSFICEYSGDLITEEEGLARDEAYAERGEVGCYMFYFVHRKKTLCIDSTHSKGGTVGFGRLVNHSRQNANIKVVKVVDRNKTPRLVMFAARDIRAGEELLFDYGERDKDVMEALPWLAE